MRETDKRRNSKLLVTVLLAAVLLVCVAGIVIYFVRQNRSEGIYDDMRKNADKTVGSETLNSTETGNEQTVYEDFPQVDFDTLRETNTDICAWIKIPGTQVDYPVLRNEASSNPYDDYYLQHTVEKASGLPGAIYMEPVNSADFTDGNTVLYGHNMKNGTMFGSLHQFEDDVFFNEHEYLYVVTPEKNLVYRIFAVVQYSDIHIMGNYDFDDEGEFEDFLDSLRENRSMGDLFREGTDVTAKDCIVTLSTCIKGQDEKRLLVEAVLVDVFQR